MKFTTFWRPAAPRAPSPVLYNDYSLAERDFLAGEQGAQLIEHWRRWYHDQPTMLAPSDSTPLLGATASAL